MTGFFDAVVLQRRALVLILASLVVLSVFAVRQLPTSILPEVTFPRIKLVADSGELPSDAMLRTVTRPLEESLRRVPGVVEIRSVTSRGSTEINLDCRWNSDMNLTLQRVQAQMEGARPQLPPGTTMDARLMSPTLFPVLGFSLTSDRVSPALLRDAAALVVKPELSRLPGVAEVILQGGHKLEARVTLDPTALEARGLTASGVAEAIRRSAVLQPVGLLESNGQLYLGLSDGRPSDLAALGSFPVPLPSGPPVALAHLGTITLEEAPEFVRYQARNRQAVLLNVLRQSSASAIALSRSAHRWFADHARQLPPGTVVETFYDQSDLVRASVSSVRDSLVVGAILAFIVVILFLRSLRLGLAGASVLLFSIALTLIGLALARQSLNMMTLGGIAAAVGLVLDDGIVVVEHLAMRTSGPDAVPRAQAMGEILPILVGSSLCSLAIFFPFVFLGGVTGAFFRVLALSMVLMLGASLAFCLTLVPLVSPARGRPEAHTSSGKNRRFRGWVDGSIERHRAAALGAAILIILAIPLYASLGSGFLPEMDEGSLILDYVSPPGMSLTETDRMLRQVEIEIAKIPEIVSWSRRTGDQLGFFITEPNMGDYALRLKMGHRRSADEIADDLRGRIEKTQPALEVEIGQLVEDVIGDLTTTPQPIEVRVFSEDRTVARAKAGEVAALLQKVHGVVDLKSGIVVSGPTVTIAPNEAAARLGMGASELADAATPAVSGADVGEIVRGARAWRVRAVIPRPPGLSGADVLARVPVLVGSGGHALLGELASIHTNPGETEIVHDNLRTMVAVTARLSGRDLGSAMAEIQRRVKREIVLPTDASVQYAGLWAEQQSSFRGLTVVALAAAALVAMILLVSFQAWAEVIAVLFIVLASLAGVFAALRVTGATFNISSFVGVIMMVGIVSENAYFLVAAFQAAVRAGATGAEAARAAAARRARPVLMTTFAGIAALAPLALGLGAGSALLRPLAIAVIGGFSLSAFLLLLVLPSLLARYAAPRRPAHP
ncbi:MAG TPA: efflux RND transporter permease subunit [Candidatus Limnocylindrales bacterium]|nr:efflux RND transporter permease subunit [Candidatus Limnocylindrales bacterium]